MVTDRMYNWGTVASASLWLSGAAVEGGGGRETQDVRRAGNSLTSALNQPRLEFQLQLPFEKVDLTEP